MFCAIRRVKNKKSTKGRSKRIEVYTSKYEDEPTKYGYTYSQEKFERPPKDSYQISIQQSDFEHDKVQKKQWNIVTINYYDFIEDYYSWQDFISQEELNMLLKEMDITLDQLEYMVSKKLRLLIDEILSEWEHTEEYKVTCQIHNIIKKHHQRKASFELKWGRDTYDYIYDVFGRLRNVDFLDWLQDPDKTKCSYQEYADKNDHHDKSNYDRSSHKERLGKFSASEKILLKKFYRTLAKEFHPDINGNTEAMTLINKLKSEWDI